MILYQYKSIKELINVFNNKQACYTYIAMHRWNTGVIDCPHCSCEKVYVFKDGKRYKCKSCRRIFTGITNTFMHGTKLPLQDWLIAMWLVSSKKGISSVQLAKELNVTQKTAWYILQKIRLGMGNEIFRQLEGTVEIDEAFVGGKDRFKHKRKKLKHTPGRNWKDKVSVLGMLERGGIVRAMIVPNVQMLALKKAVYTHVKPGSDVMGDGFQGYRSLMAYNVQCTDHSSAFYVNGEVHTNTIEGFWSQMKKTFAATYHKVSKKHLQNYLNESAFRYNNRNLVMQHQVERILWNSNIRITNKQLAAA